MSKYNSSEYGDVVFRPRGFTLGQPVTIKSLSQPINGEVTGWISHNLIRVKSDQGEKLYAREHLTCVHSSDNDGHCHWCDVVVNTDLHDYADCSCDDVFARAAREELERISYTGTPDEMPKL